MTPPTQQSDVDEAIAEIEYEIGISGFSLSMTDHIKSLITEIHRLRLERGIAVDGLKRVMAYNQSGSWWLPTLDDIARETLQKLGEKV